MEKGVSETGQITVSVETEEQKVLWEHEEGWH